MNDWIVPIAPDPDAPVCVIGLPHPGGGPNFYAPWADARGVEILAVQPPGREARTAELPITDLPRLVRQTANAIAGICERRPTALFGHSGGGRYAFEVCRALERANRGPALLCPSGISAPDHPYWTSTAEKLLTDPVTAYLMLGGEALPGQIEHDQATVDSFISLIRADARLYTGLGIQPPVPLRCAVAAFAGDDDAIADPEDMAGWQQWAAGPEAFTPHRYPGDHFYIRHHFQEVLDDLLTDLTSTASPVTRTGQQTALSHSQ
ncbi:MULTISPECIES: thioesterase II family protein [unclassified Streptomyces]|uniref:thioesterase II family protein n=1 Tax=unclassified Streptomyces TaxID=2593676 RepID=UPI0029A38F8F|nr:alpha/beta fold hydrolase [Streptomyces sp. ME18-1-4]MDX3240523.1 alpha/beta fold hydrolase [Streptomyces sp. ME18-1-4]